MNLKNRQHLLGLIAGGVIVLFALDRLIVTPLSSAWTSRSETIRLLRESISKGQSLIERETITRDLWNDMRRQSLPANASQAEKTVLEAFDRWSRDAGVSVSSIKPQWKRGATEDYSVLECRVDASGDLGTLARFLYDVEQSAMGLRMESVELAARDTEGRQLSLALSVSGLRLTPLALN